MGGNTTVFPPQKSLAGLQATAAEIDGAVNPVPKNLLSQVKANSWLWKHFATTTVLADTWWAYTPIDNGYYSIFALGKFGAIAPASRHLGRMGLGLIGSYKHHDGVGVVKTGSFTNSSFDYAPKGNATYSVTAGDTISFPIKGHTAVLRTATIVNGGYAVVSVDGDFTIANRLPKFTADDFTAGRCRETDVGKCYVNCGSVANFPDYHIPIFEGLEDTDHTVVFETTGTKGGAYSSGYRSYVSGVVGCSSTDVGTTLTADSKVIANVEMVQDFGVFGASAMVYTPEIEKTTANTWEFSGEVHSGETDVSWVVEVDGVDKSAITGNTYAQGAVVRFHKVTTLATTDATGTPVAKKKIDIVCSAYTDINCTVNWSCEWLVDKRVRSSYPLMLPIAVAKQEASVKKQDRWTQVEFGSYTSTPSDLTTNDNAMHGTVKADCAIASSSLHDVKAYCAMLDNRKSVNDFALSTPSSVSLHDRSDFYDKVYFFRSTQQNIERFYAGDIIGGIVGFGIKKGA